MKSSTPGQRTPFPALYWLVILFEFFERGAYYGMMSVLSVYLTDHLHFAKQDVGIIKGTIQPLLYFLPILSGAIADRFGYRRALLVAFGLLGGGYLLTAQAQEYATVFLSLVVVGFGAGTFKPIISGSIARCTDQSNSTLGFGIYYWSINLGAFLVPLLLVPLLKAKLGWSWVILASAIGTGAMLVPTLLLFREPPAPREREERAEARPGLLQTLANAFEIIYSPFVLLRELCWRSSGGRALLLAAASLLIVAGGCLFLRAPEQQVWLAAPRYTLGEVTVTARLQRNLGKQPGYQLERLGQTTGQPGWVRLVLHKPDHLEQMAGSLSEELRRLGAAGAGLAWLRGVRADLERKVSLEVAIERGLPEPWQLESQAGRNRLRLRDAGSYGTSKALILAQLRDRPGLGGLLAADLDDQVNKASKRPFLVLFLGLLLATSLLVLGLQRRFQTGRPPLRAALVVGTLVLLAAAIWMMPFLSLFARVLCTVIGSTVVALYAIRTGDVARFRDHFRFLLMIFIYSGFWVLYFQMFDSVLWYVQAYVDTGSLDEAVNAVLAALGVSARWHFDIEHVTVINAGTIILLQLLISSLVKNTRALPTMVAGIGFGTLGMAVLALSTGIWVFILGITIFSIGEMTAHPKFIAYVGQTAPKSRVALYMGYLFLYGVVGSSIGGVLGARLYVRFVDELNRPRALWLIFAGIGLCTMVGLLIYNRFAVKEPEARAES